MTAPMGAWRLRAALAPLLVLAAPAAHAQSAASDYRTDRPHGLPQQAEGAAGYDAAKPWTFGLLLPFLWQTNPASAPSNPRSGTDLAPEATLGWAGQTGALELAVEGGAFLSDMAPVRGNDSSGWFGSAQLTLGDAGERFAPYARYDVVAVYLDRFGTHDLTRHGLTLGVARSFGDTSLDLFATRSPTSGGVADRNVIGLSLGQELAAGPVGILLAADVEQRFYDFHPDFGRHRSVNRIGLGAMAALPLSRAAKLAFSAEAQRYRSNDPDWCFTNFLIGPRLLLQFGF